MFALSVWDIAAARPPCLERASSMMMAKRLPRCSAPMASAMNGNVCAVVMMIFLPFGYKDAQICGGFGGTLVEGASRRARFAVDAGDNAAEAVS